MCRHQRSIKVKGDTPKYRAPLRLIFLAKAQGGNTPLIRELVSQKIGAFWSKNTTSSPSEEISMAVKGARKKCYTYTGDGSNKFQFW